MVMFEKRKKKKIQVRIEPSSKRKITQLDWGPAQGPLKDLARLRPSMWMQTYELGRVFGLDRIVRDLTCWYHELFSRQSTTWPSLLDEEYLPN